MVYKCGSNNYEKLYPPTLWGKGGLLNLVLRLCSLTVTTRDICLEVLITFPFYTQPGSIHVSDLIWMWPKLSHKTGILLLGPTRDNYGIHLQCKVYNTQWGSPSASDPWAKNTGQRATKGTVLTSQSLSPWCDCRRLGSTLASWRWQDINVGNPLWRRALFKPTFITNWLSIHNTVHVMCSDDIADKCICELSQRAWYRVDTLAGPCGRGHGLGPFSLHKKRQVCKRVSHFEVRRGF